jgi:hypothetical protein
MLINFIYLIFIFLNTILNNFSKCDDIDSKYSIIDKQSYRQNIKKLDDHESNVDDIFSNIECIEELPEPKFEEPSYFIEKIRKYGIKLVLSFYRFKNWINAKWNLIFSKKKESINSQSI